MDDKNEWCSVLIADTQRGLDVPTKVSSGGFRHLCNEQGCHQELIIHLACKKNDNQPAANSPPLVPENTSSANPDWSMNCYGMLYGMGTLNYSVI